MSKFVLDSSALLALLFKERGADVVRAALPDVVISTVNLAETVSKLAQRGMGRPDIDALLYLLNIECSPFTEAQAMICGELRPATRARGLSLGDRACLALARERGIEAMTADAAWVGATDVKLILIR